MQKKQIAAIVLVPASILAIVATWRMSQAPSAKSDAESLKQQTAMLESARGPGAPGGFDPGKMQAQMLEQMSKELSLTSVQKERIGPIQVAQMPKMQQVMMDSALTMEQKQSKISQAAKEQEEQIKAILSPEQQTRYDAMQKRMRDNMQQMRSAMGAGNSSPDGMPPGGMMPPDSMPNNTKRPNGF